MNLPASDGVIVLRSFVDDDRSAIVTARDDEWARWLGPGDPHPSPTAVIEADGAAVGWIDVDRDASWLGTGEANVGYAIFPQHRRHGYAARAVRLLASTWRDASTRRLVLVIDASNDRSRRVATAAHAQLADSRVLPHLPSSVLYEIDVARDVPRSPRDERASDSSTDGEPGATAGA